MEIGPALPPHLLKKKQENGKGEKESAAVNTVGPALPPWMTKGKEKTEDKNDEEDCFGPALPPGFKKSVPEPDSSSSSSSEEEIIGPTIGPLPPSGPTVTPQLSIAEEIEKRSKKMKDKLTGNEEPEKLEREEWMVELPPVLQGFGMGPRTFRTNAPEIGDRSVWTDTPSEKAKKKQMPVGAEPEVVEVLSKREAEVEQALEEFNKSNRQESLMQMHDKKMKRKKKEEREDDKKKERREFDRDTDLQANRFDEAKKKRLLKQSAGLSTRFSKSTTSTSFL